MERVVAIRVAVGLALVALAKEVVDNCPICRNWTDLPDRQMGSSEMEAEVQAAEERAAAAERRHSSK